MPSGQRNVPPLVMFHDGTGSAAARPGRLAIDGTILPLDEAPRTIQLKVYMTFREHPCPLWVISGHLVRHAGVSAFCRLTDMFSVGIDVC